MGIGMMKIGVGFLQHDGIHIGLHIIGGPEHGEHEQPPPQLLAASISMISSSTGAANVNWTRSNATKTTKGLNLFYLIFKINNFPYISSCWELLAKIN